MVAPLLTKIEWNMYISYSSQYVLLTPGGTWILVLHAWPEVFKTYPNNQNLSSWGKTPPNKNFLRFCIRFYPKQSFLGERVGGIEEFEKTTPKHLLIESSKKDLSHENRHILTPNRDSWESRSVPKNTTFFLAFLCSRMFATLVFEWPPGC